jgi:uncharacterized phage protein (TIGR01671 family)
MRDIKFDYIIKRNDGTIAHRVWSLNNLEFGDTAEWYLIMLKNNSKVIAKRQYTGIKDKNGVEIYDGDMVRVSEKLYSNNEFVGEVAITVDGALVLGVVEQGKMSNNWGLLSQFNCEVIGNIYDNRELLK